MHFELDVKNFLSTLDENEIQQMTNNKLAFLYYQYKGVDQDTTIIGWLCGIGDEKYPHQVQLGNIIRKLRNSNAKWRKGTKK